MVGELVICDCEALGVRASRPPLVPKRGEKGLRSFVKWGDKTPLTPDPSPQGRGEDGEQGRRRSIERAGRPRSQELYASPTNSRSL
jgi:hypothetical protein